MRRFVTVVSVVACLGIPSARAAAQAIPAAGGPVRRVDGPLADSVRAFAFDMVRLLRARDTRGVIALYADTLHFVHVEDGVVIPWPQLARTMRTYFATVASNPVTIVGEPGVAILDRNSAAVYVTHRSDSTASRPAHTGVWTGVLRRDRAGWRIVHSHSSDR